MEQLLAILSEIHPDIDFKAEEDLIARGLLDSYDVISIAAELDAGMGVSLPAEELVPENFYSAKALYALVQRLNRP